MTCVEPRPPASCFDRLRMRPPFAILMPSLSKHEAER